MAMTSAEVSKRYRARHPERAKADSARARASGRAREAMARYRERHPEYLELGRAASLAYYYANREAVLVKQRGHRLRRKGLTEAEYDARLLAQGGVCAVCRSDDPGRAGLGRFAVDTNHATNGSEGSFALDATRRSAWRLTRHSDCAISRTTSSALKRRWLEWP